MNQLYQLVCGFKYVIMICGVYSKSIEMIGSNDMTEKQSKILKDFKEFHSGNHTVNHREQQVGAQTRAISGIKKMSIKKLAEDKK